MGKLYAIRLDEHSEAELLVSPSLEGAEAQAWNVDEEVVERGTATLSQALEMVRAIGQCAIGKLADLDVESTEATIGLKLTGKGKFVVAEVGAEATLNVKFKINKRAAS